jgi:TAP-like protein
MKRHYPNPILLIGTRFDPNTPLANAGLAERRLGNAVLLTHDGRFSRCVCHRRVTTHGLSAHLGQAAPRPHRARPSVR